MTHDTCATCTAFDRHGRPDHWGYCRRRAPQLDAAAEIAFPMVSSVDDWCLEHIPVVNPPDVMGEAVGAFRTARYRP